DRAAEILQQAGASTLFIGSAYATVEDNYLLTKLAEALGADAPVYIPHVEPGAGDGWLLTDDKTPNANGCERLGMQPIDEQLVQTRLRSGDVKAVYVLEDDPVASGIITAADLANVPVVLHHYHKTNE